MDKRIKYGLSVILAILIIVAILIYTGINNFWNTITHMDPIWFLPMILVYAIDWLIRGLRWKIILGTCKVNLSVPESTAHTLIGNTANLVVPAKLGDLARVYSIKKLHNVPVSVGLSSVFFDRVFDFIGVAILTVCIFFVVPMIKLPGWTVWVLFGAAVVALLVLVLIVLVIKKPSIFKRFFKGYLKRFENAFDKLHESFKDTVNKPIILIVITVLSVTIWSLEAFITYLLSLGLHIHVPLWMIFFTIMIANLTKTLPLTPGGIGVYEGVFSALFLAFGYPLTDGTSLGVIDHLFKNVFTVVCGGAAASWFGVKVTKLSDDQKDKKIDS